MKTALIAALLLTVACTTAEPRRATSDPGRLRARPREEATACEAGETRLALSSGPDAYLYVPDSAATKAAPLLVFLHGAGGRPEKILVSMRPEADEHGFLLLVPGSVGETWDGIRGTPGIDAERIDEALRATFGRCAVDRRRIAVGGFSDGASYALTLGVANGDLLSHVIAFSPCGVSRDVMQRGRPRVFISHGRADPVLPFDRCGSPIAAALQRAGYQVRFLEFEGKHEVPDAVGRAAFLWFTK